jgi:hypothetical protein
MFSVIKNVLLSPFPEPSLMMPGIIISFVFSEQTMLIVCTAPV